MNRYFYITLLCWSFISGITFGAPAPIKMENQLSLQYMLKMLDVMRDVAPEQEKAFAKFDKNLKMFLMDARALQRDYHLAEQKGLRGKEDRDKTYAKGLELLEKTISETELYLETLLKGLKDHRAQIKDTLLPKPKDK